jgi:hypothetical protein
MLPQNTALLGDSIDLQRSYHLNKIKLLEEELSHLTILEHPREIHDICCSIIDLKKSLETISATDRISKKD